MQPTDINEIQNVKNLKTKWIIGFDSLYTNIFQQKK